MDNCLLISASVEFRLLIKFNKTIGGLRPQKDLMEELILFPVLFDCEIPDLIRDNTRNSTKTAITHSENYHLGQSKKKMKKRKLVLNFCKYNKLSRFKQAFNNMEYVDPKSQKKTCFVGD